MSSSPADAPPTDVPAQPSTQQEKTSRPSSSAAAAPVEMSTIPPSAPAPATATATATTTTPTTDAAAPPAPTAAPSTSQEAQPPTNSAAAQAPTAPRLAPPADLTRTETEAIGPSTDTPAAKPDNSQGPVVVITLLLTTGARHPYKIDERYLKKRNVVVDDMDPYNISVYTLKELIWRDWREEWEPRPSSPSSIRLIHFGRMLDDKAPLKECRFQTEAPNVVHMTVKPQEMVDEEESKAIKTTMSRRQGEEEPTAGCRCVIL